MNPRCPIKNLEDFVDVAESSGSTGREDCQAQWQSAVAAYINNASVLDVGAGLCRSLDRLCVRGLRVITQDVFPGSKADMTCPIESVPDKAFDYCTSFDVIEHVPDYEGFFKNLARISKKGFAVSTPNYFLSQNLHRFHVREFCPDELQILADELGLIVEKAWCQLPGRGVFAVDTGGLTIHNETTHGFCILFKHP